MWFRAVSRGPDGKMRHRTPPGPGISMKRLGRALEAPCPQWRRLSGGLGGWGAEPPQEDL
eukprot:15437352-Alexandrium_andersonii.AAC.1